MRFLTTAALAMATTLALHAGDVPRPAKPLTLKTLDGQEIALNQLHGKVVAVFFFSTDCPHCQHTTQVLNPIYAAWKSRGLEILGLAVNPSAAGNLQEFKQKFGAAFPLGLTTRSDWSGFGEFSVMYNPYVPYLIIVDRNGVVREEHPGQDRTFWLDQENNLRESFDTLLKERAKKAS
jgi:cytochrome c biogenesis protein CcmG, thiol:disulfide interchange protein DsbE